MSESTNAVDALMRRRSKASAAWRQRRYLYQAAERFDYCEHFGFPADAERDMWMSLLLWSAPLSALWNVRAALGVTTPLGQGNSHHTPMESKDDHE
jgi:hypothetical protein